MKYVRDPEGAEIDRLAAACRLSGRTVLEVGCGRGQLTGQFSGWPRRLIGIDPASSELCQVARTYTNLPSVYCVQASGEALPLRSQLFDIVLFSSSL